MKKQTHWLFQQMEHHIANWFKPLKSKENFGETAMIANYLALSLKESVKFLELERWEGFQEAGLSSLRKGDAIGAGSSEGAPCNWSWDEWKKLGTGPISMAR